MCCRSPATAALMLRLGLGVEFLLFGYGKLTDVGAWAGFITPWMSPLIPVSADTLLTAVGAMEVVLGVLLLIGFWTRIVALLAAIHLVGILMALGYNDLAVRDFVAFTAAIALAALGPAGGHWSVDGNIEHRNPKS